MRIIRLVLFHDIPCNQGPVILYSLAGVNMTRQYSKILLAYIIISIGVMIFMGQLALAQDWSEPVRISDQHTGHYPYILTQGDFVHVVYRNDINQYQVKYVRSSDSGQTWSSPELLNSGDTAAVGTVQLLSFGSLILCAWDRQEFNTFRQNIYYRISTDDGVSWLPIQQVLNPDWDSIIKFAISNSEQLINISIVYPYGYGSIYNVRSTDFGQSWSEARLIYPTYLVSGRCDQSSSGDYVHFVWSGAFPGGGLHLYYANSSDGGITWSDSVWLNGTESWDQTPMISSTVDGHVGVTWIQRGPLKLRQSFDFGDHWGSTITVGPDDSNNDYCDIVIKDSLIYLAWMQNRSNPPDLESILFTKSSDNGLTWDDHYWVDREDHQSLNPRISVFQNRVFAIWQDWRVDAGSVYFSRWPDWPDGIEDKEELLPEKITLSAYPNPFNSSTTISYRGLESDCNLSLFDISGRLVRTFAIGVRAGEVTWDANDEMGHSVSSGIYFVNISDLADRPTLKLLLLK